MKTRATGIGLALLVSAAMPVNLLADDGPGGLPQLEHLRRLPNNLPFPNSTGFAATISTAGHIDLTNEFFQDLGANGRRCVSCHLPSAGWTIVPSQVQAIFNRTLGGGIDDPLGLGAILRTNDESNGATQGHAKAPNPITDAQREAIVAFETALATAQVWDEQAKNLNAADAKGGPGAILGQAFYYGINDNLGDYRTQAPFTPIVFDIYDEWSHRQGGGTNEARRAVARGQA